MPSLCITTYVYGKYIEYIPSFVYSVQAAYPDAYVKIFTPDRLTDTLHSLLSVLRQETFQVREGYRISKIFDRQKHARWLLPEDEFKDFDYLYVGDIDFVIVRETPSLLDLHKEHCSRIGKPYSNLIRPKRPTKLSGLHFIERQLYYASMARVIQDAVEHATAVPKQSNEVFLYELVEKAFGAPGPVPSQADFAKWRPHHGYHLGLLRIGRNPGKHEYTAYWQQLVPAAYTVVTSELYAQILRMVRRPVRQQLKTLKGYVETEHNLRTSGTR